MPPTPPLLRRSLAVSAGAAMAGVSLRALARPLPASTERRLVDWAAVRRTAHARCGEIGAAGVPGAEEIGARYDAMAAALAPLMREVVLTEIPAFPPFAVLDRRGFIDANLQIAGRLLEPVERLRGRIPESRATALSRTLVSRYLGELFGFLSRRVLGQYDPVLIIAPPAGDVPAPTLSLVEPNVAAFERRQQAPPDGLRRWLVLHELTHAWQFGAHPWLADHITGILHELLYNELVEKLADGADGGAAAPRPRVAPAALLRSAVPAARAQVRAIGRIQAVMSLAEGYGNFVMHRVGAAHIDDFERLDRAFHDRAASRGVLDQLVLAVTGMRMKLRQYELGERFADEVTRRGGLELLNRVWEGPEMLPSMAEIRDPARWVRRAG